jgi:ribonuclease HII|tara:strand:+ start:231 stop:806 length:576 start_codon:yes stop_codon:yes gene_type:complete
MTGAYGPVIAGVDEAGRGPLAGPVVAAAVILSHSVDLSGLTDSKALTQKRREAFEPKIRELSWDWSIAASSPGEIDRLNIHQATLLAMRRAILGLKQTPDYVLVDGCFYPRVPYPGEAIVRGDQSQPAISAASILAKVFRDRYMRGLDARFTGYGFSRHKGYPTKAHLEALQVLGPCREHRQSFRPVLAVS